AAGSSRNCSLASFRTTKTPASSMRAAPTCPRRARPTSPLSACSATSWPAPRAKRTGPERSATKARRRGIFPPTLPFMHPPPSHDERAQRFSLATEAGEAGLEYQRRLRQVNFTHTFVPPALRGQGVAEILVRAGLAWARQQGLAVEADCSYVARFLDR